MNLELQRHPIILAVHIITLFPGISSRDYIASVSRVERLYSYVVSALIALNLGVAALVIEIAEKRGPVWQARWQVRGSAHPRQPDRLHRQHV